MNSGRRVACLIHPDKTVSGCNACAAEYLAARHARIKTAVFRHYGEECACCGSSENLTIDHVRGNGRQHMARIFAHRFVWNGSGFLDWLVKHDFPVECERGGEFELQSLCYRCNTSKGTTEACRFPHWCQICGLPINTGKVVGRRVKCCPDHGGIGGGAGKPERAGLRSYTRARSTGTHVGVYDGTEAGMDAAGGRWKTVCEEHGWIISHPYLYQALSVAPRPQEWCDVCSGRLPARPEGEVSAQAARSGMAGKGVWCGDAVINARHEQVRQGPFSVKRSGSLLRQAQGLQTGS